MNIEERKKYIENLEEFITKQVLTRQDVENKIEDIKRIAEKFNIAEENEKKKLKKKLDYGKEIVKSQSDRKYEIIFFYDKKENKIVLQNIVEFVKINHNVMICFDLILSVHAVFQLFKYSQQILLNIIFSVFIFVLNACTIYWYRKEKDNRYSFLGKDWLETLLLSLDHLNEIEKFRVSRTFLFLVLYLFYTSLLPIEALGLFQRSIYLVFSIISLLMFIRNFFKITNFNFFYFVVIILLAILGGSVRSANWEAIVALIAIVSLLFSDDIWKISPRFKNPLKGRYQSKNNTEIVQRNIFKYKLILSILSFVLFIIIGLLEDRVIIGSLLFGDRVKCLDVITLLLFKGIDRFIIGFLLVLLYMGVKKFRKYLLSKGKKFEEPLVNRLFQLVYKDIKLSSPIIKSNIKIDKSIANNFEPKTLIENLDDLPDNIIVIMDKPIKNGKNTLIIQYSDGSEILKKEVQITLENRQ